MIKKILKPVHHFFSRYPYISLLLWLGFLIANMFKAHILAYITLILFGISGISLVVDNHEEHVKLRNRIQESRDSSSSLWDGCVRSDNDLLPRYNLLKERVYRDSLEMEQIYQRLSYLKKQETNS